MSISGIGRHCFKLTVPAQCRLYVELLVAVEACLVGLTRVSLHCLNVCGCRELSELAAALDRKLEASAAGQPARGPVITEWLKLLPPNQAGEPRARF
jgi:hypothetical protein